MKQDDTPPSLFAIYDRPRDFPNHLVVRCWTFDAEGTLRPDRQVLTFDVHELGHRGAIAAARSYCKRLGLTFVPRNKGDDPVLVETWQGRLEPAHDVFAAAARPARTARASV